MRLRYGIKPFNSNELKNNTFNRFYRILINIKNG